MAKCEVKATITEYHLTLEEEEAIQLRELLGNLTGKALSGNINHPVSPLLKIWYALTKEGKISLNTPHRLVVDGKVSFVEQEK